MSIWNNNMVKDKTIRAMLPPNQLCLCQSPPACTVGARRDHHHQLGEYVDPANGYSPVNSASYYPYSFLVEPLMLRQHIFLASAVFFPNVPSVNAPTYLFNDGLIQSVLAWKALYLQSISVNNGRR